MSRKIWYFIAAGAIIAGAIIGAVLDATSEPQVEYIESEAYVDTLGVERITNLDKEYVLMHFADADTCKWYETCIQMSDLFDSDSSYVAGIANVFQVEYRSKGIFGKGTKSTVYVIAHTADKDSIDCRKGFWVEDWNMYDEELCPIRLTFQEAYDSLCVSEFGKPHSRYCVLRSAIGPKMANPQYIFGNKFNHIYVDAVTGDVTDVCPCGLPEDEQDPY